MDSLDFPSNPTNGQTYALNGVTYYYNSSMGAWLTQIVASTITSSSNTQVMFNDAGVSNGSYGLVFDKTANTLSVTNLTLGGSNTYNWINSSFNTANAAFNTANAAFAAANTKVTTGKSIAMAIVFS